MVSRLLKKPVTQAPTSSVSDGKEIREFVQNIKGSPYVLVTQINLEELEAPIVEAKKKFVWMLIISLVLAGLMSYVVGAIISRRIERLALIANKLSTASSEKDVDNLANMIETGKGIKEVRLLSTAIRRLANSIKLALESLK